MVWMALGVGKTPKRILGWLVGWLVGEIVVVVCTICRGSVRVFLIIDTRGYVAAFVPVLLSRAWSRTEPRAAVTAYQKLDA